MAMSDTITQIRTEKGLMQINMLTIGEAAVASADLSLGDWRDFTEHRHGEVDLRYLFDPARTLL